MKEWQIEICSTFLLDEPVYRGWKALVATYRPVENTNIWSIFTCGQFSHNTGQTKEIVQVCSWNISTHIQNSHKKGIHSKYFGIRNIWQLETDATIPLPFLPLQAFPPGLTSLTPRQPAKYLNLFASFFSLFLGKVKVFLVALSSSLSRDYYKHLSGPLLVFGVAWLSQAFCCSNIAAKISVNLCLECDLMKMPPLSNNLCFCWNIVLVFCGSGIREKSHACLQGSFCWPIVLQYTNGALQSSVIICFYIVSVVRHVDFEPRRWALLFALSFLSAFCLHSVSCVSLSLCALCALGAFTSNKTGISRLLKKYWPAALKNHCFKTYQVMSWTIYHHLCYLFYNHHESIIIKYQLTRTIVFHYLARWTRLRAWSRAMALTATFKWASSRTLWRDMA